MIRKLRQWKCNECRNHNNNNPSAGDNTTSMCEPHVALNISCGLAQLDALICDHTVLHSREYINISPSYNYQCAMLYSTTPAYNFLAP
jgi:hypothetical protein